MIGYQPTGTIEGVVISAVSHEGLTVTVNGKQGRLAILDEHGCVVASGPHVAREAEAVAVNSFCQLLEGQGHMRVESNPLASDQTGC